MKVPTQFYGDHFINHENPGLPIKRPIEYHQGYFFSKSDHPNRVFFLVAFLGVGFTTPLPPRNGKSCSDNSPVGMVFPGRKTQLYKLGGSYKKLHD